MKYEYDYLITLQNQNTSNLLLAILVTCFLTIFFILVIVSAIYALRYCWWKAKMKHIAREVPMTQRLRGRGASRVVFISNNVSVSEVKIRIDVPLILPLSPIQEVNASFCCISKKHEHYAPKQIRKTN